MKIAIQNNEYGERGGINTYSNRLLKYLNNEEDVESIMFVNGFRKFNPDLICVQYEPGMLPPQRLGQMLQEFTQPIVVIAHHTLGLDNLFPLLDGVIVHNEGQLSKENKPWDYKVISHPSLVYEKKDKDKLREKYNLPKDKRIVGTMGFIVGTGKRLPIMVEELLKNIKDDEFLYLITSFWKGGDGGRSKAIMNKVKQLGKEDNFRMDTDFVKEETLNEKMQCCDLLFSWSQQTNDLPGSQSGSAADMYGSRVKLIVKDVPHYSFISQQDNVEIGRRGVTEFVEDVFKLLRGDTLSDVQNPEHLSWENMISEYVDYFKEMI